MFCRHFKRSTKTLGCHCSLWLFSSFLFTVSFVFRSNHRLFSCTDTISFSLEVSVWQEQMNLAKATKKWVLSCSFFDLNRDSYPCINKNTTQDVSLAKFAICKQSLNASKVELYVEKVKVDNQIKKGIIYHFNFP